MSAILLDLTAFTGQHLPLDGGGWEGVWTGPDASCLNIPIPIPITPRKGEGADRACGER
jgi:hypothetical protein